MSTCEKLISAIGDTGVEQVPTSMTVPVAAVPLGDGNTVVPATLRWQSAFRSGGIPTRVRRIKWPTKRNGLRFASVEFDCTPFVRYTLDTGPIYGDWSGCCVRNLGDAFDPVFDGLSPGELKRIERAGAISERFNSL